jgi:hypothetical protein
MEGNLEGNFAGKKFGENGKKEISGYGEGNYFLGVETLIPLRIPVPKIYKLCFFERVYSL